MYGWRGRIGLLLPTANTTNEPEFNQMAPHGVSIHANRVYLKDVTPEELAKMIDNVARPARELAACEVDVMAFGCTSGSFVSGPGYDQKITEKIQQACGVTTTTTSTAVLNALGAVKAKKVAVATPYTDEVNAAEKGFLEAAGFEVVDIKGLGLVETIDIQNQPAERSFRLARAVNSAEVDTIFISCTGFRTIDHLARLEKDLNKPVVSSNQATFWDCMRLLGINDDLSAFGSLFNSL